MKFYLRLFTYALCLMAAPYICLGANNQKKQDQSSTGTQAKYIFYFIGDGMSVSQVRLAEAALESEDFANRYAELTKTPANKEKLNLKSLKVTGLATSNAENRFITDSAAAGTALATGSKTNVGVIGESADGQRLTTIAEKAKQKGMKVGVVTSVSMDHATPACFYSHTASRSNYSDISDQLLTSGFDYFGGGSVKWDSRAKAEGVDAATAYASYKKKAEDKGFKYVTTKAEFDAVGKGETKPVIATLDMLANEQYGADGFALPYTIDLYKHANEDNKISLAQFTQKGIDLLDNKDGFFMMVEGGKIDWTCHANDAASCAYEVVAFDQAIGVAMEFAKKHPDQTLIVVTGDHDCGGLTIGFAGTGYATTFSLLARSKTSFREFAADAVARIDAGEDFDTLLAHACESFGFTNDVTDGSDGVITPTAELSDYEVELLRKAYAKSAIKNKKERFDSADVYQASYGGFDPFTTTCTNILNNKAGLDFTSYKHTAIPVLVFAEGANQDLFSGYYDNTDIPKKIMQASGLE